MAANLAGLFLVVKKKFKGRIKYLLKKKKKEARGPIFLKYLINSEVSF